jgi:glutamate synthase (NADPH/NADH) large chain
MVDIDPLDDADASFVLGLIRRHHEETGSEVAERLLADWPASLTRLSKVMPRDYKRVLEVGAKAQAEGRDINLAIMEAVNG